LAEKDLRFITNNNATIAIMINAYCAGQIARLYFSKTFKNASVVNGSFIV
jgi:hypothetical protein